MSIVFLCIGFYLLLLVLRSKILSKNKLAGLMSVFLNKLHGWYRSSAVLHAAGRIFLDRKVPKNLPHLTNIEKVSERTYRVLGLNPGSHTLQGTNTWLVTGTSKDGKTGHVLIDSGEDVTAEKYVNFLFNEVFPQTGTKFLSKILLTHGHGDHQGGVLAILKELKARSMLPLPTIYKRKIPGGGNFPEKGFACKHIEDDELFEVDEETTIQAVYTPGHTDDHVAFILQQDGALLSGDCVLGCGTTVFDDLYHYMKSLQKIRNLIVDSTMNKHIRGYTIERIYPGHGPIIDNPLAKIDEYITHREAREKQILKALVELNKKHGTQQWISAWSLVEVVYGPLSLMVKVSAQHNLTHHLKKLETEKKVVQTFPDMWSAVAE